MNIRTTGLLPLICVATLFGFLTSPAAGDDRYEGVVTGRDVYVRATAELNAPNQVTKLNEPQKVTVTSKHSDDWLTILPAPGCYSVISKQYVEVQPGTKIGEVTGNKVKVRAAGTLKQKNFFFLQTYLNRGDTVRIIGEARDNSGQQWYIIKPPAAVRFYISARFVKPASEYKRKKEIEPEPVGRDTLGPSIKPETTLSAATKPAGHVAIRPREIRSVRKEMQTLRLIRKLEKNLIAESKKTVEKRNFSKILVEAKKIHVPKTSRFRPIYESLLSYIQDELKLAEQRQVAADLLSDALSPVVPSPIIAPVEKPRLRGYDLEGIMKISDLYSGGPGRQRFVVRDAQTYRIRGYVQDSTGSLSLRDYVGKNVGITGKASLDKNLSLTIFEAEKIEEIGKTKPKIVESVEPEPVKPKPATPEPVKPEPVKPEPTTPEPVKPEPVTPEPVRPEVWKPGTIVPEPAPPTKPKPWKQTMVEPTPLVKPEPVKPTVAPVVKPEPAKPIVAPVVKPEPVKPIVVPVVKPEPVKSAPPVVKPEPVKPTIAPVVKPEPAKPIVAPVVKPEPVKPTIAPVVKPEPVKPIVAPVVKPEPVRPTVPTTGDEPPQPAPIKLSPVKPQPIKSGPAKPAPIKLPSVKPQPIPAKQVKPAPARVVAPIAPTIKPQPTRTQPANVKLPAPPATKTRLIEIEWD